jgi:hypothetical protein
MVTGRWNDIGNFKGPVLRALAARAPFFHDGSAATRADVIAFYETRFQIGFTDREEGRSAGVASVRSRKAARMIAKPVRPPSPPTRPGPGRYGTVTATSAVGTLSPALFSERTRM